MRSFRLIVSAALTLLFAACSGSDETTLTLTVEPSTVEVAGGNFALVTVSGRAGNASIQEQSEISLSTTAGFLGDKDASAGSATETALLLNISGQKATAKLFSPSKPAKATVTARYIDPYGVEVTATATVEFVVPVVTKLEFSCSAKNIGALIEGAADMNIRCDATPYAADGTAVRNADVKFLTEAGGFARLQQDSDIDSRVLFTYNPRDGGKMPRDVDPIGAEPYWTDPETNQIRNPRDGLVTLVAYVEAPNDGFLGEPYVDENDNGKWDPGEPFFDANDNGVWDDQQDTHLWKMIKILWTGAAHTGNSKMETTGTGTDIERGMTRNFTFTFLDQNMNVLASNGARDVLYWQVEEGQVGFVGSSEVRFGGGSSPFGMDIDPVSYKLRNPGDETSYKRGARYSVTLRNDNKNVEGEPPVPVPEPYQVFAEVTRAVETDEYGEPENEHFERLPVGAYGTLK